MTLAFLPPSFFSLLTRSKSALPLSRVPPTALSSQSLDSVQTAIAATALTILLSTSPVLPQTLNNFPAVPPSHLPSSLTCVEESQLEQISTLLSTDSVPSQTIDSLPIITPSHPPSSLSSTEKSQLKQVSRKHTRAAGKIAQKFSLARRQESSGQTDAALQNYDEIIAADPSFAPAYSNRGNLLAAKKFYDQAIRDYNRSLQLAPLDSDSWVVYVNRGCTKLARGDEPHDALADMNLADELNSRNAIVLANRAGVWEMMGKWDNAIRDYQTALNSNDVQPFWNRYALVLFQRGKGDEALAILKRVAARFNAPDVHAAMAIVYYDRGDIASAETQWTMVDRPRLFESRDFLEETRKWPPRALNVMDNFRTLK